MTCDVASYVMRCDLLCDVVSCDAMWCLYVICDVLGHDIFGSQ